MAIIHGNINAGGGSNKPLSEQTYEKTPIQEVQLALETGETYYLKTSGLPTYQSSYGTDYPIIFYQADSPVSGISFANQTIDANNTKQVLLTAFTTYSDSIFQGHIFVYYNGAWKRYQNSIIDGQTVINFYTMTSTELEHFYMVMTSRGNINDMDLAIACLQTEIDEDRYITTGYTKETLGEKVNDLKNWVYESSTSAPSLLLHPNMEALKEYYDGMFDGQSRLIYGSYGTPQPDNIYIIGYADNGEITSCYLTYYNSTEDEYYNYYSDTNNEYTQTNVWLKGGEPISGVPSFTYDSSKVVNEFAFPFIYGTVTTITTLDQKINSISGGGSGGGGDQPQTGLLKNQIYDETTETTGIIDGETYDFKSNMGFSSTDDDLGSLQPDDYIYDDGTKDIQFVVETDFLNRTFAYLVYNVHSEQTSYYYTVAQFGDGAPEFINEWADETVPSIQVNLSGIINENIFVKMLDVEISDITVQKTLEQKLSEFKTWIYGYKEGGAGALEAKTYNIKMADINLDFENAQNNQLIASNSNFELVYYNFYSNGNNVMALNYYSNSLNLDLYYHPSFNCWKEWNYNDYTGDPLVFSVDLTRVNDEDALKEILGLAGGGETPVTLEERIETPLKTWTYDTQEGGSGTGETSIKPIFDSLPILFGNIETFIDSGLLDDNYTREILYQTQSNVIAWSFFNSTSLIKIEYMIPDFDNELITVFENVITPTGQNTGTSEWTVHVEPFEPTGDELYAVNPITSQDELPVFENFDATQAESGYSDVVALLVGEVTSSGSSSGGSITLEQKIADLKNWTYENTEESDKFYTTPKWTDMLAYISEDLIPTSPYTYDVYEKQNENNTWEFITATYDSSNDNLGIDAFMNGNRYACFNYQYTESTSGDVCDADTWYEVEVAYGPGQNPGEPGPAIFNYTELTTLPNLTIDSTAILIQDLFDAIVVHTDAVNQTLDEKLESIVGFSGDYDDLTNKPAYTISNVVTDNSEVLGIQVYNAERGVLYNVMSANTLGTASTCDTGTGAGNVPILDANGKLNDSVLPALSISETFVVNSQASMLALTAQQGDVCVRTDLNKSYILKTAGASTLANWQELLTPTDAVQSVNGHTGTVTLTQADLNIIYSSTQPSNPVTGMIWIAPAS